MPPINAIQFDRVIDESYEASPKARGLWGFSRVNLFCGSNNSGKSRFLRWMYANLLAGNGPILIKDFSDVKSYMNSHNSLSNLQKEITRNKHRLRNHEAVEHLNTRPIHENSIRLVLYDETFGDDFWDLLLNPRHIDQFIQSSLELIRDESKKALVHSKSVYVPSVRTCRSIAGGSDFYNHIVKSYFQETRVSQSINPSNVYTGRGIYNLIRKKLLGSPSDRLQVEKLEKFLSKSFFDGNNVALMPREADGGAEDLHIRIFPERERKVAELGDGLQQLVIIFAPLFLISTDFLFLFIEEPELYLHPGMQRRMMEALLCLEADELGKDFQVFMATHSNHIVDMQIRDKAVSVHRFQKQLPTPLPEGVDEAEHEQDPKITIHQSQPGDFEILGDLGVVRSSVYLANCTIWVEGPSDRKIIQRYIHVQNQESEKNGGRVWLEDRDYAFVMYGGSLLANWGFVNEDGPDARRMCSDALIVCDGDISDKGKGSREQKLINNVGEDHVYKIPCREIENSLGYEFIKRFVVETSGVIEDGLVNKRQTDMDYMHLGKFIQSMHADKEKFAKWKSKDGGLTQYRKGQLAKFAEKHIQSLGDCSEIGIEIGERIISFIQDKNP